MWHTCHCSAPLPRGNHGNHAAAMLVGWHAVAAMAEVCCQSSSHASGVAHCGSHGGLGGVLWQPWRVRGCGGHGVADIMAGVCCCSRWGGRVMLMTAMAGACCGSHDGRGMLWQPWWRCAVQLWQPWRRSGVLWQPFFFKNKWACNTPLESSWHGEQNQTKRNQKGNFWLNPSRFGAIGKKRPYYGCHSKTPPWPPQHSSTMTAVG